MEVEDGWDAHGTELLGTTFLFVLIHESNSPRLYNILDVYANFLGHIFSNPLLTYVARGQAILKQATHPMHVITLLLSMQPKQFTRHTAGGIDLYVNANKTNSYVSIEKKPYPVKMAVKIVETLTTLAAASDLLKLMSICA